MIKVVDLFNQKIDDLERVQRENDDNPDKMSNLYKLGIINENGIPINNRMK